MALKYFLRHKQIFDKDQNMVYYDGTNPYNLIVKPGPVPDGEFHEFTNFIQINGKLDISYKAKSSGDDANISNADKGVSSTLTFIGDAYTYLNDWLNNHPAAALNQIEVKIEDTECGVYDNFLIKSDGISFCDDGYCRIDASLTTNTYQYQCIQNTLVADNHMGMFDGKYQHPRFAYCNDKDPLMLSIIIGLLTLLAVIITVILIPVLSVFTVIKYIAKFLAAATILPFFGNSSIWNDIDSIPDISNLNDFTDFISDIVISASGCGDEISSPLIRDYIRNVCTKCNISYDEKSIPIFFDPSSPYYNLTYFDPEVAGGVDEDSKVYWNNDNDPVMALSDMLNHLKPVFNADWMVRNSKLYFNRWDLVYNQDYIFDFTDADKDLKIGGVCTEWNEKKKSAYTRIGYTKDPTDTAADTTFSRFNDLVEHNNPINPSLEGEGNKILEDFCSVRVRQDGTSSDYIEKALKNIRFTKTFSFGIVDFEERYKKALKKYNGAILMQNDTVSLAKLVIWDGVSRKGARVYGKLRQYAKPSESRQIMPPPNFMYNKDGLTFSEYHGYTTNYDDYYGIPLYLYNWDMSFDSHFKGNLWDRFHQRDDPRVNPPINKTFTLQMTSCCSAIQKLGLLNGGEGVALNGKIRLNNNSFYNDGEIKEIIANLRDDGKSIKTITLKGNVI